MLQILQGAQLGFVEVRGLTVKMNVLSIFTMGPSLLGRSEGMLPQEILKIRYPKLAKIDFSIHEKCDKIQSYSQHIYTKVIQKRITPQACFRNIRLKNEKFTASRTEIGSITYHDQTFNHDITHKIH